MNPDEATIDELDLSADFHRRFELCELIGRGGMGLVFKGIQKDLGRPVAIKFLRADYSATDPAALRRFIDEGKICSTLSHPNVVKLFLCGSDTVLYLVYEFIDGESLEALLERTPGGRLPLEKALPLAIQVCRGLGHAHEMQVVHRDMKPANVLLDRAAGMAKVTDFGIARNPLTGNRTKTGIVIGTPTYIAPEQARGEKDLDPACDVYSLCAMFYEMFGGRPPYSGAMIEVLRQHVDPTVKALSLSHVNPAVPARLSEIIAKGLEKERDLRWRDGNELADALDDLYTTVAKGGSLRRPGLSGSGAETRALSSKKLSIGPGAGMAMAASRSGGTTGSAAGGTVALPARGTGRIGRRGSRGISLAEDGSGVTRSATGGISSVAVDTTGPVRRRRVAVIAGCLAALVLAGVGWWITGAPVSVSPEPVIDSLVLSVEGHLVSVRWRTTDTVSSRATIDGLGGWKAAGRVVSSQAGTMHSLEGRCAGLRRRPVVIDIDCSGGGRFQLTIPPLHLRLLVPQSIEGDYDDLAGRTRAGWILDGDIVLRRCDGRRRETPVVLDVERKEQWTNLHLDTSSSEGGDALRPLVDLELAGRGGGIDFRLDIEGLPELSEDRDWVELALDGGRTPDAPPRGGDTSRAVDGRPDWYRWSELSERVSELKSAAGSLGAVARFAALFKEGVRLGRESPAPRSVPSGQGRRGTVAGDTEGGRAAVPSSTGGGQSHARGDIVVSGPGPGLVAGSPEWKQACGIFRDFNDRYARAAALTLVNPLETVQDREELFRALAALRLLLNRMAASSLYDAQNPLWRPKERNETPGFWVPYVGLCEAVAPLCRYDEFRSEKAWDDYCERSRLSLILWSLENETRELGSSDSYRRSLSHRERDSAAERSRWQWGMGLLPPANVDRRYLFDRKGKVAPHFLSVPSLRFRDIDEKFLFGLPSSRNVRVTAELPRMGRVALAVKAWFLDVAYVLRCRIGKDRYVDLLARRCNDLHGYVLTLKDFTRRNFYPGVDILEEKPAWYVAEFPVDWLDGCSSVSITCLCLGLPVRIGSNQRLRYKLIGKFGNPNPFLNVPVIEEVRLCVVK